MERVAPEQGGVPKWSSGVVLEMYAGLSNLAWRARPSSSGTSTQDSQLSVRHDASLGAADSGAQLVATGSNAT
jgi:hypothetical protein